MSGDLVRNSLRLAVAAFLTAAIALWFERILFVWYPLIAVVVTIDDSDEQTIKAAIARILGTILGGFVTFAVHSVLAGWIGVLVSLLLMLPLLRLLGWEAATGTATLISILFLMVPRYSALNWDYVFNRGLDTAVGCLIAILVGLLFWPNNALERLDQEERALKLRLGEQLRRYRGWLRDGADRPEPLNPAPFSASVQRLETLLDQEQHGPHRLHLLHHRWPERLALWRGVRHHWLCLERLLAALPPRLPAGVGQVADGPIGMLITNLEQALNHHSSCRPGPGPVAMSPAMVAEADRIDQGRGPAFTRAIGAMVVPDGAGLAPASAANPLPSADEEQRAAPASGLATQDWLELARSANLPPLLVLAIANEQDAAARGLAALNGRR